MRWAARRRLRVLRSMALVAAAGGGVYGMIVSPDYATGLMVGVVTGLMIAVPLTLFELYFVDARAGERFRRLPFGWLLAAKTLAYLAVILVGLEASRRLTAVGDAPALRLDRVFLWNIVFSLAFAAVVNFVMQIRRVLGPGVLGNLIVGRYHRPREETRVFLFLDLVGSTALAERIGGPRFLDLLNRLYMHITEPIAEHGGEIHKYVGDEVIVT
jgi:adenylate cyclase